jgi:hypothetical protein
MMCLLGKYEVTGPRIYRGHHPGEIFEARIGPNAEARAIARGSITLLERVPNDLRPNSYQLPAGWLTTAAKKGSGIANG